MRFLLLFLILVSVNVLVAQSKLQVEITNIKNNKGNVALELLDKNNESIEGKKGKIVDNKCTIIFENLKNDKYAIRFFHDENENEELDTNFIGIPKEGYGFSNDAYGKFGPKDFEEWLFEVSGDTKIKMKTQN